MSDIVDRLRALKIMDEVGSDNPLGRDAADEIDRLRPYVEAFRREESRADKLEQKVEEAADEIERLRKRAASTEGIVLEQFYEIERLRERLAKAEALIKPEEYY